MKITFLDASTVGLMNDVAELNALGELKLYQTTEAKETLKRVKGSEIIITNKVVIDKKIISKSPDLKLICVAATGMNNIDLEAAKEKGIIVKNVKGYSTESVAQHTFSLLFHLTNHLAYYSHYVSSGKYSRSPVFTNLGREIYEINGKKFGIIGLGAIGQRVAELALAFGAEVQYYSTSGSHNDSRYQRANLDELLSTSDILSIHAPLTAATKDLVGMNEFKKCKSNCIILNTGRGGIIKEKELVSALNKNLIAAAAVDVYEKEPLSKGHPYYKIKQKEKLLLTPHVAWASVEARKELLHRIYRNIASYIEEKK